MTKEMIRGHDWCNIVLLCCQELDENLKTNFMSVSKLALKASKLSLLQSLERGKMLLRPTS